MVLQVHWGMSSQARIWLEELPDWFLPDATVSEQRIAVGALGQGEQRCMAAELLLPGPKYRYGGLGATFIPNDTGTLAIYVAHTSQSGAPLVDTLASCVDIVHRGLTDEYVPAVLMNSRVLDEAVALGAGVLEFSCATHGEIGSSYADFTKLARIVIQLLHRKPGTEADMITLLRAEISGT